MTSTGELVAIRRGEPDFDGAVVHLGALGAVTRVTLRVEPGYDVSQEVFENLTWEALTDHFDELMAVGDSVSVFTTWGEVAGRVWVKRRCDRPPPRPSLARALRGHGRHPPASPDRGRRSEHLHASARAPGSVVRAPPPFPARVHPKRRRGAPVRVHPRARRRDRRDRGGASSARRDPPAAACQRDPHDCRR